MHNAAAQLFCPTGFDAAFAPQAWLAAMLAFEKALFQAQFEQNLMQKHLPPTVFTCFDAINFDATQIAADGGNAASLAVPLVAALKAEVAKRHGSDAAKCIHAGATSQDVLDTAQCLLSLPVLAQLESDTEALATRLLALAKAHARTPMLARTLMQPASVTSFGFTCAGAAASIWRGLQRVRAAKPSALRLQLAGAVGTQAQLKMLCADPSVGSKVQARMAELLGLSTPAAWPTHTWRDEWLSLATAVATLCGSVGKLANDWALQCQFELGELQISAPGQGASSAMPHKRNPVACVVARGAAARAAASAGAMLACAGQAHQRAHGEWQAELAEWPELLLSTGAAVQSMAQGAAHLQVDGARMLSNVQALRQAVDANTADEWFDPLLANDAGEQALALAELVEREMTSVK